MGPFEFYKQQIQTPVQVGENLKYLFPDCQFDR